MAAKAQSKSAPRLRSLDELYLLGDSHPTPARKDTLLNAAPAYTPLAELDIEQLIPFVAHPFRLYEGERLEDMVDSISKNGVLVPVLVRRQGDKYELLSGHNRANAAKLAGLVTVPAIIKENLSDEDAWVYVVETNLMQRSFGDMSHSEKAAVISLQHSKLFSQGKRNDILRELEALENPHDSRENGTSVEISQKLSSRESLAKEYGLKPFRVAQYIRIFQLVDSLKLRLDKDDIAIATAVSLSYLKEDEQELLVKCLTLNNFSVDMIKAQTLRQYSESGKLDDDSIYLILSGELGQKPKPNRTPAVKIRKTVYAKYFKPGQSTKEVQDIVERALEAYFSNNEG